MYLLHLNEKGLADGSFRFYVAGIKFLYSTTLHQEWVDAIKFGKRPLKLPMVLDLSEVETLFSVTDNIKHKVMLMIMYSSGLRIREVSTLKMQTHDGVCPSGQRAQRSLYHFVTNLPGGVKAILA